MTKDEERADAPFRSSSPAAWLAGALLVLVVMVPVLAGQQPADPAAALPRITVAELEKLLDATAVVVLDVRDAGSYAAGHIPGATSVPLDQVDRQAPRLKTTAKPLVTYCS
jgi:3-mercaptopyruvate sulfurtransferase SseA